MLQEHCKVKIKVKELAGISEREDGCVTLELQQAPIQGITVCKESEVTHVLHRSIVLN